MKHNESELIKKAEKLGYRSGTLIDYEENLGGTDTLGNGEFELKKLSRNFRLNKNGFRTCATIFLKNVQLFLCCKISFERLPAQY